MLTRLGFERFPSIRNHGPDLVGHSRHRSPKNHLSIPVGNGAPHDRKIVGTKRDHLASSSRSAPRADLGGRGSSGFRRKRVHRAAESVPKMEGHPSPGPDHERKKRTFS